MAFESSTDDGRQSLINIDKIACSKCGKINSNFNVFKNDKAFKTQRRQDRLICTCKEKTFFQWLLGLAGFSTQKVCLGDSESDPRCEYVKLKAPVKEDEVVESSLEDDEPNENHTGRKTAIIKNTFGKPKPQRRSTKTRYSINRSSSLSSLAYSLQSERKSGQSERKNSRKSSRKSSGKVNKIISSHEKSQWVINKPFKNLEAEIQSLEFALSSHDPPLETVVSKNLVKNRRNKPRSSNPITYNVFHNYRSRKLYVFKPKVVRPTCQKPLQHLSYQNCSNNSTICLKTLAHDLNMQRLEAKLFSYSGGLNATRFDTERRQFNKNNASIGFDCSAYVPNRYTAGERLPTNCLKLCGSLKVSKSPKHPPLINHPCNTPASYSLSNPVRCPHNKGEKGQQNNYNQTRVDCTSPFQRSYSAGDRSHKSHTQSRSRSCSKGRHPLVVYRNHYPKVIACVCPSPRHEPREKSRKDQSKWKIRKLVTNSPFITKKPTRENKYRTGSPRRSGLDQEQIYSPFVSPNRSCPPGMIYGRCVTNCCTKRVPQKSTGAGLARLNAPTSRINTLKKSLKNEKDIIDKLLNRYGIDQSNLISRSCPASWVVSSCPDTISVMKRVNKCSRRNSPCSSNIPMPRLNADNRPTRFLDFCQSSDAAENPTNESAVDIKVVKNIKPCTCDFIVAPHCIRRKGPRSLVREYMATLEPPKAIPRIKKTSSKAGTSSIGEVSPSSVKTIKSKTQETKIGKKSKGKGSKAVGKKMAKDEKKATEEQDEKEQNEYQDGNNNNGGKESSPRKKRNGNNNSFDRCVSPLKKAVSHNPGEATSSKKRKVGIIRDVTYTSPRKKPDGNNNSYGVSVSPTKKKISGSNIHKPNSRTINKKPDGNNNSFGPETSPTKSSRYAPPLKLYDMPTPSRLSTAPNFGHSSFADLGYTRPISTPFYTTSMLRTSYDNMPFPTSMNNARSLRHFYDQRRELRQAITDPGGSSWQSMLDYGASSRKQSYSNFLEASSTSPKKRSSTTLNNVSQLRKSAKKKSKSRVRSPNLGSKKSDVKIPITSPKIPQRTSFTPRKSFVQGSLPNKTSGHSGDKTPLSGNDVLEAVKAKLLGDSAVLQSKLASPRWPELPRTREVEVKRTERSEVEQDNVTEENIKSSEKAEQLETKDLEGSIHDHEDSEDNGTDVDISPQQFKLLSPKAFKLIEPNVIPSVNLSVKPRAVWEETINEEFESSVDYPQMDNVSHPEPELEPLPERLYLPSTSMSPVIKMTTTSTLPAPKQRSPAKQNSTIREELDQKISTEIPKAALADAIPSTTTVNLLHQQMPIPMVASNDHQASQDISPAPKQSLAAKLVPQASPVPVFQSLLSRFSDNVQILVRTKENVKERNEMQAHTSRNGEDKDTLGQTEVNAGSPLPSEEIHQEHSLGQENKSKNRVPNEIKEIVPKDATNPLIKSDQCRMKRLKTSSISKTVAYNSPSNALPAVVADATNLASKFPYELVGNGGHAVEVEICHTTTERMYMEKNVQMQSRGPDIEGNVAEKLSVRFRNSIDGEGENVAKKMLQNISGETSVDPEDYECLPNKMVCLVNMATNPQVENIKSQLEQGEAGVHNTLLDKTSNQKQSNNELHVIKAPITITSDGAQPCTSLEGIKRQQNADLNIGSSVDPVQIGTGQGGGSGCSTPASTRSILNAIGSSESLFQKVGNAYTPSMIMSAKKAFMSRLKGESMTSVVDETNNKHVENLPPCKSALSDGENPFSGLISQSSGSGHGAPRMSPESVETLSDDMKRYISEHGTPV